MKQRYLLSKSKFAFGNCILHVIWLLEQGRIDVSCIVITLKYKCCGCEVLLAEWGGESGEWGSGGGVPPGSHSLSTANFKIFFPFEIFSPIFLHKISQDEILFWCGGPCICTLVCDKPFDEHLLSQVSWGEVSHITCPAFEGDL